MEWPFQKGDVAQHILEPSSKRIAFRRVSVACQDHKRKIRPSRLRLDTFRQCRQFICRESFFDHDAKRGTFAKRFT
jgi:hypothetical protein